MSSQGQRLLRALPKQQETYPQLSFSAASATTTPPRGTTSIPHHQSINRSMSPGTTTGLPHKKITPPPSPARPQKLVIHKTPTKDHQQQQQPRSPLHSHSTTPIPTPHSAPRTFLLQTPVTPTAAATSHSSNNISSGFMSVIPKDTTPNAALLFTPTPSSAAKRPRENEEVKPYVGIQNLGATCYLGSILCALRAVPFLVETLASYSRTSSLAKEITQLIDSTQRNVSGGPPASPGSLVQYVSTVLQDPLFQSTSVQQDAHEVLTSLLRHLEAEKASLYDLLNLKSRHTLRCIQCGHVTDVDEVQAIVSLPLPTGLVRSALEDLSLMALFERSFELEETVEYTCVVCGSLKAASRRHVVSSSDVLVLQLQRFQGAGGEKLHTSVIASPRFIVNDQRYQLVSVVSHFGSSALSGHYVADFVHVSQGDGLQHIYHQNDHVVDKAIENWWHPTLVATKSTGYMFVYMKLERFQELVKSRQQQQQMQTQDTL